MQFKANMDPVMLTFMERMLCDAIVMALYIRGGERPLFMDEHIEHCQRTFGITFERWERNTDEMFARQCRCTLKPIQD